MKAFSAPQTSIGALDAQTAASVIAMAADVALVVNAEGEIQDVAFQRADLAMELEGGGRWQGRRLDDIVTPESQQKVAALMAEVASQGAARWRQLTHQTPLGRDVAILYTAVRLGGNIVAIGRDLRAVAALQQKLIDAQMSMERDFAKLRFAETRYRLLFQTSPEPVVVLEAGTSKIVEANPAAASLLGGASQRRVGTRAFGDLFEATSRPRIQAALTELRSAGKADDVEAHLADGRSVMVTTTLFRQDAASLVLARLGPSMPALLPHDGRASFADFAHLAPDGFVLADNDGRVLAANAAFVEMVQAGGADEIRGSLLEQWIGRTGVDFDVMMANLRQHGSIRLFATVLHARGGAEVSVETSAVALGAGKGGTFGFSVRDVGRRLGPTAGAGQELPRSATELAELIGRVPLRDIVRETSDVIEKLCIEKALELTGDNRASAAEMLGLSRQSLYVKLRRFGFDDAVAEH